MQLLNTEINGIHLISPQKFQDKRGDFYEIFNEKRYQDLGLDINYFQDNFSYSKKNVLRGLHFCKSKPQTQLLTVLHGHIFDVVVDLRKNSKTFGKWLSFDLSSESISQIYMKKDLLMVSMSFQNSHIYTIKLVRIMMQKMILESFGMIVSLQLIGLVKIQSFQIKIKIFLILEIFKFFRQYIN